MEDRTLTNTQYCIARALQRDPKDFRVKDAPPVRMPPQCFPLPQETYSSVCPECDRKISGKSERGLRVKMQNHRVQHVLTRFAL
jgi:hypothetical protein